MSKLDEMIRELCPDGLPSLRRFGKIQMATAATN